MPGSADAYFSLLDLQKHGHFATIRNGSTTLYFGPQQSLGTLTSDSCHPMAADVIVITAKDKPHLVPCSRNHNHTANKHHTALKLLCASSRSKDAHTGALYPGEYIF
jgi:hypothetical protein